MYDIIDVGRGSIMNEFNTSKVRETLSMNIEKYIYLIKNEYGTYMPEENLKRLNDIKNFKQILKIYDYGEVSAYANEQNIMMPLCADRILRIFSKIPGYGINKKHKPYNQDNIVINNNTFLTYLKHIFISGSGAVEYYDDLLLHETMHFCGSDGGSVLKEGINELLTRMLAKKYNLRTNSCGYPKEVVLAYKLMNLFGEEKIIKLAFIHNFNQEVDFIRTELGEDLAKLYYQIRQLAEKEFFEKYYLHMREFKGIQGILKKVLFYKKIDYSNIYKLIDEYYKENENKMTK